MATYANTEYSISVREADVAALAKAKEQEAKHKRVAVRVDSMTVYWVTPTRANELRKIVAEKQNPKK